MEDISQQTVCRAEVLTGLALQRSSQWWQEMMRRRRAAQPSHAPTALPALPDAPSAALSTLDAARDNFTITMHSFRSDASNTSVWQRRKLFCCSLESAYLSGYDLRGFSDLVKACATSCAISKRVADVLPVSDGTSIGTLALLQKQFHGLGCENWSEAVASTRSTRCKCFVHQCLLLFREDEGT